MCIRIYEGVDKWGGALAIGGLNPSPPIFSSHNYVHVAVTGRKQSKWSYRSRDSNRYN